MEAYPDIPAFTESVPEAEKYLNIPYTLLSFVVNNDTPQDVVDVLKAASQKVFADPEWTDFVKQKAADPVYEEYTDDASIQKFYDNWKSVICWLQYDNGVAEKSLRILVLQELQSDSYSSAYGGTVIWKC